MKNLLLFSFLLAGGTAFAQPVQTLYYPNGKKYMEGHWTFTKRSMLPHVMGVEEKSQRRPTNYRSSSGVPDADQALQQSHGWLLVKDQTTFLNITPEGMVTYWGLDGVDYQQITYKGGVPNGLFAAYYGPDQPQQSGNLVNGMPDGPWTYFYKNGRPFYTGTYKALSQAQLEQLWADDYSGLKAGQRGSRSFRVNGFDALTSLASSMGVSKLFYNGLMEGSLKEGVFNFWQKDGTKWAEIAFDSDQPTGNWKIWEGRRKAPKLILEWEAGAVVFVTDSTGRRTNLEMRLQEAEVRRQAESKANQGRLFTDPTSIALALGTAATEPFKAYNHVAQMPEFVGNVSTWISKNLRYPPAALKDSVEGRVVVEFIIQPDGRITDATVEKGVRPDLDREALRVINAMPKWEPGKQNGKAVPVYFTILVKFKLPQ